jgi:hypothetical protein
MRLELEANDVAEFDGFVRGMTDQPLDPAQREPPVPMVCRAMA